MSLSPPAPESVQLATEISQHEKFSKTRKKVFLSYSYSEVHNKSQNLHLAEEILRPILEMLSFEVYSYYHDHSQRMKPMDWIESTVKTSDILVALLTKDLKTINEKEEAEWHPKENIPNEIGMASESSLVIPFAETGVKVCSNVNNKFHCPTFARENYGEMIVELMGILKKEKQLEFSLP